MIKKAFFFLTMAFFAFACKNEGTNTTNEAIADAAVSEMATLTVEGFDDKAGDFVGKKIMINGTVDHTCKHSGKRMVIIGEDYRFMAWIA